MLSKSWNRRSRGAFNKKIKEDEALTKVGKSLAQDVPLEEWLDAVLGSSNRSRFIDYQFPTEAHKDEYIRTIESRSEDEVVKLVRKFWFRHVGWELTRAIWNGSALWRKLIPPGLES